MAYAPISRGGRYIYCIPPHTHALLRLTVQSVTPSHVAYYTESGVAVDRLTGEVLPDARPGGEEGPIAVVPRSRLDATRAYEGVAPPETRYFSSFESFDLLRELALVRYGIDAIVDLPESDPLTVLRREMMEAHPDHGGTEEAFRAARAAYERVRIRRSAPD